MKLLSINYIPGCEIEALGMVKGTIVQTKNIGRAFMAGMKTLVGGEIVGYTEMLNEARQIAVKRMVDEAKELNADAVRDARSNAKRNGVNNIEFYQNDAGKFLVEMAQQDAKVDVVLMDPPRSGSSEEFLNSVARLAPKRVVYISCNPETLVRDLKYLTQKGYTVEKGVAVDMFPFTDSCEAVVRLIRTGK